MRSGGCGYRRRVGDVRVGEVVVYTYSYMTLQDYFWMPSVMKLCFIAFAVGFILGSIYMWVFGNWNVEIGRDG